MEKRIVIAAVILTVLGIASDTNYFIMHPILNALAFSIHIGVTERPILFSGFNVFNLAFFILLIAAALLYWVSKFRETRLLRFLFSIMLFGKVLELLVFAIFLASTFKREYMRWLHHIGIKAVTMAAVIFISWWILRLLSKSRETVYEEIQYEGFTRKSNELATNWQRFFNLVMDIVVCTIIFLPLFFTLMNFEWFVKLTYDMTGVFGEKLSLLIVICSFRFIYYLFFEAFFKATPAKFLSETRVVDEDGNTLGFGRILKRTVIRFVPFEAWSFFAGRNWHDQGSCTEVAVERRQGASGRRYFLLIPLMLFVILGVFFGKKSYYNYKGRKAAELAFTRKHDRMVSKLSHLTTDDVLSVNSFTSHWNDYTFLKVEEVSQDAVVLSIIDPNSVNQDQEPRKFDDDDLHNQKAFEYFYLAHRNEFEKVTIKKSMLAKGIIDDFDKQYQDESEHVVNNTVGFVIPNKGFYVIREITAYFGANISLEAREYSTTGEVKFSVQNEGWPAELIKVENIDGGLIQQPRQLPAKIVRYGMILEGNAEAGDEFVFRITVRDTIGRKQVYETTVNKVLYDMDRFSVGYDVETVRLK